MVRVVCNGTCGLHKSIVFNGSLLGCKKKGSTLIFVDLRYFIQIFFTVFSSVLRIPEKISRYFRSSFSSFRVLIMDQNHTIRGYLFNHLISEVQYQISYHGSAKHMEKTLRFYLPRALS